jgi:hypothetical protein
MFLLTRTNYTEGEHMLCYVNMPRMSGYHPGIVAWTGVRISFRLSLLNSLWVLVAICAIHSHLVYQPIQMNRGYD